jgi:serine protease AprX
MRESELSSLGQSPRCQRCSKQSSGRRAGPPRHVSLRGGVEIFTRSLGRKIGSLFLILSLLIGQGAVLPSAIHAENPHWDKIDPDLRDAMAENLSGEFHVCVEMEIDTTGSPDPHGSAKRADAALRLIREHKGEFANPLGIIGGACGVLKRGKIIALSTKPSVAYIRLDSLFAVDGTLEAAGDAELSNVYPELIRADEAWALGYTGTGVTVAVLDSGVAPVNDLTQPTSRLLASVDFVDSGTAHRDPGGHGTHVAGIIAGNGYDSNGALKGVAPDANIVSVRVINQHGKATASSIIRGIQWCVDNRETYNIRVMNLSLGGTPSVSYKNDLLAAAIEMAWKAGIVVVTAAGNHGPGSGSISTPGHDPFNIAVGAIDDKGTPDPSDDDVPYFSARGPTLNGDHKPDILAPGRRILSLYALNSYLDGALPGRQMLSSLGRPYFRLTGTSMAAPVVSGVVALLLQKNPDLTPDQVKYILTKTAPNFRGSRDTVGTGVVDAYAALTSDKMGVANKGIRPADTFARNVYELLYGQELSWKDPNYMGIDWENLAWDNLAWDNLAWDNLAWDNLAWDNLAWDNLAWDNLAWDNLAWDNLAWDNLGWDAGEWDSINEAGVPWETVIELD